jgi:ribosomal protein S18 acetylase RimI-like enzyme
MHELPPGVQQQPRAWDSEFFGLCVGEVRVTRDLPGAILIDCLKCLPYDLIYVCLAGNWAALMCDLSTAARHVDDRYAFQRPTRPGKMHANIAVVSGPASPPLLTLTLAAGHQSRFRKDQRLRPYFARMYQTWLERALSGRPLSEVFAYEMSGQAVGLVTVSGGDVGQVGLLAVDPSHRRQGIGAALLDAADCWYSRHGIATCRIVTQKSNTGAVELYHKAGYALMEQTAIFHFWRQPPTLEETVDCHGLTR